MQPKESKNSRHFFISLLKSGVRIWAGVLLVCYSNSLIASAGGLLVCAEFLGILEEF